jgi:glycosyltransferase involved in cell wall biosynthesis
MRVIHLLRKYDPAEWGGTESAVQRLFAGLRKHGVTPVMYCPKLAKANRDSTDPTDPFELKRFRAFVPICGISREYRRQLVAVGGNLLSFDLLPALLAERDAELIHTHTLGRLGSIASVVARARRLPFVISIHGGLFDLPAPLKDDFENAKSVGYDWGKIFGAMLNSRDLVSRADAILTCNPKEAQLVRERYPNKRVQVQPHGINTASYASDRRPAALDAFPQLQGREVLLCVGRIDPVKNQGWVVAEAPAIVRRHPKAVIVFAGPCTDAAYGEKIRQQISDSGLNDHVLLTGGLPPADPRLIGLFQLARAVVLPSISETFGLVIIEAWAAGTPTISSRTSGGTSLIKPGQNGWLFDLEDSAGFHRAVDEAISRPELHAKCAEAGRQLVLAEYDQSAVAGQVKKLYEELIAYNGQRQAERAKPKTVGDVRAPHVRQTPC